MYVPPFRPQIFRGGKYVDIIKEDVPEKEQKPMMVRMTDAAGKYIDTKLVPRPPIPGKNAAFVKDIYSRFKKKADQILSYLMEKANEVRAHSDKHSGYSEFKILWDTELDREMTPAQKVAFLLQGTFPEALKGKLAKEVDGFH